VSPAGTSKPIKIFELVCEIGPNGTNSLSEEKKRELLSWKACYGLYVDRNWGAALKAFEAHLQETSRPILVETYIGRCRAFIADPPAEDWDGAFIFDAK
jgi:adenylate cyclase